MKIYDISVAISPELPVFPGDPPVRIDPVTRLDSGDQSNVSRLTLSSHCGTHIDVARHYSDQGLSVEGLPLDLLIGEVLVADLCGIQSIGSAELSRLPLKGVERIILKTDNSLLWEKLGFCEEYAPLTLDGARYLLDAGVKLVGIDYLSIERFDGEGEVHRLLLGNGVIVVEGLNLAGVASGIYELICLPLKIMDGDGAPARVILRVKTDSVKMSDFDPHSIKWPCLEQDITT